MAQIQSFTNNPYQENTYILYDESGECAIIDPGMDTAREQNVVVNFIRDNHLKPVLLLNTHCHIDHVLGNKFIFDQYGLKPKFHEGELPVLEAVVAYAPMMGIRYEVSPVPDEYLSEKGTIKFGNTELQLIFAPGHSPAHLCFYDKEGNQLVGGDVLFRGSIGRTDLPGGNFSQLMDNIEHKLFTLPDDCIVYPGHGPETTIGYEKQTNPFLT
ncbi:MBL fold metallo-hydrolase [Mucilaginibacter gotjawali]|uniref:Glyoxylase-like metal-dependent hydrolase (Beta-lactamase superfamily II) n=1 Tax=Mucilaginibacter gotjawali TaxID=1550579 RepID=A0A839SKL1_9SPHI|nr:MBL fold metallo-hydrolase [Mucilaginibacter gotjawali]MBB3057007.1 glyoxylase-like metal-dependent hydrolase (beta-lactamase superfamily II) [Mucilaginibacter gotjawali]